MLLGEKSPAEGPEALIPETSERSSDLQSTRETWFTLGGRSSPLVRTTQAMQLRNTWQRLLERPDAAA